MHKRSSIIGGVLLILLGVLFLLLQTFPGFALLFNISQQWPLIFIAAGGLFFLGALLGAFPLAIPGAIISGIGALLYYQNLTGNWGSWAYAWTLFPGFVGVGLILMGLLDRENRGATAAGLRLLLISLVMFAIFGAFFGAFGLLGQLWPILLIGAGLWLLWRNRRMEQHAGK